MASKLVASALALLAPCLLVIACAGSSEPSPETDSNTGGGTGSTTTTTDGTGAAGGTSQNTGGSGAGCTPETPENCECTPGETLDCYSGPDGTSGVGLCKSGVRTCQQDGEFGTFGPCVGEVLPTAETCDDAGLDEDCNGASDEACPCVPSDEVCDGVDNDCDGQVDEGLVQACGGSGSCDVQLCTGGQWGACGAGTVVFEDSFEAAAAPVVGIAAPNAVSSFTVEAGDVDTMIDPAGFFGPAHTGDIAIDLNGWGSGKIGTTVATDVGSTYVLTFAYTKNPGKQDPGPATANVTVDAAPVLSLSVDPANTYSDLQWQCAAIVVTAANASTTLELESTNPGNGGVYLDTFVMKKQ